MPFVYSRGHSIVFVDAREESWEIRDYMRISGRIMRLGHPSVAAEYRVFVPAEGPCRLCAFGASESREPEPELLARQFSRALPTRRKTTEALQDEPLLQFVPAVHDDPMWAEASA